MVKEKLVITKKEAGINITNSEVDSIRFLDKLFQGYRVYDNQKIGVAGAKGTADDEIMFKKAQKALENNISYDVEVSKNHNEKVFLTKNFLSEKDFLEKIKQLMVKLNDKYPNFIFSNKINYTKDSCRLSNSENLDLYFEDEYLSFSLLIKDRSSSNIFDTGFGANERYYDEEKIINDISVYLDKFDNIVDIDEGEYPIIIEFGYVGRKLINDLRGDIVASGASLFSQKIGEKVFSDKLNIYLDKNPQTTISIPFFDYEGVINNNYRYKIISDGTIVSAYTSKKIAKMYNMPVTGSARSTFDGVPAIGEIAFYVQPTDKTILELTEGKKAIFVGVASGGDFTSTGDYASPVQNAYLVEKGKIVGRLKDINISSNLFKMFNENFIGVPKENFFKYNSELPLIIKMNVSK